MKKTEESPTLPCQFQNGERVSVIFMPGIEARIRAVKFTGISIFYDLDIWMYPHPEKDIPREHSRIYNVDSAFVDELKPNKLEGKQENRYEHIEQFAIRYANTLPKDDWGVAKAAYMAGAQDFDK